MGKLFRESSQFFRRHKTKYIIAIILFALLTNFVVSNSLLPWIRQHHLGATEKFRLLAYRTAMEDSLDESESYYRVALMEAEKLQDQVLVKEISDELHEVEKLKSARSENLQFNKTSGVDCIWLWQSLMGDITRAKRNRKYMKRWMPIFNIAFHREQTLAANDPTRLIELGDWQFDSMHLPYAESLYRQAGALARRQTDEILEVQVRDRLAHVAYANQNYDEAMKDLNSALDLAQKLPKKTMTPLLVAHKAQVYAERSQPEQAIPLCKQALSMDETSKEPLLRWYLNLLLGQCLSLAGDHEQAINTLKRCEQEAQIFPPDSNTKPRVCRALAEAFLQADRTKEAESYFHKLIDLTAKDIPETPQDYEYKFVDEAENYRSLKKHKQDLFLVDMIMRSRQARIGPNSPGILNTLRIQKQAFESAGEREKAREVELKIKTLSKNEPL